MDTTVPTEDLEPSVSSPQLWALQTAGFLAEAPELAEITSTAEELAAEFDSLPAEERQKIRELSELMARAQCDVPVLALLSGDGKFEITGSEDRMSLLLSVSPPLASGEPVAANTILEWLTDRSIVQGVDVEALRQAAQAASEGQEIHDAAIVRGSPPQAGQDESGEFFGRPASDQPLQRIQESSHAPSLGMPWACQAGDRILLRVPATPGVQGYDAHGGALPPPAPSKLRIEAGQNVRVEGESYFAEIDGVIVNNSGYGIEVRPQLVVCQDITSNSPPIDFPGELQIRGAVRTGAVVVAKGDISIHGAVEAAMVESREGGITLHRGVVGRGRAVIKAKGNVVAQFAENATVLAGGSIRIHGGAMNCRLMAGSTVVLDGNKGRIIGGTTLAGEKIVVTQLGSPGGIETELCVGLSPEAMTRVAEIEQDIAATEQRLEKAVELAGLIVRAVGHPEKLSPPRLKLYVQLCQGELVCRQKLRQARRQREDALKQGAQSQEGSIDVQRKVFPGVAVRIGNAVHRHKELIENCRFGYDKQDCQVIVRPLH